MTTEVLVAIIGVMGTIGAVALPLLLRQNRKLDAVHEQVSNSHESNLRDDIDAIRQEVARGFGQMHHRLNLLQSDLAWERQERIAGDRRTEN